MLNFSILLHWFEFAIAVLYAVEMDSDAVIYIPSFIDLFRHSEVDGGVGGGGFTDTQTAW
jgi:hypothetical protein